MLGVILGFQKSLACLTLVATASDKPIFLTEDQRQEDRMQNLERARDIKRGRVSGSARLCGRESACPGEAGQRDLRADDTAFVASAERHHQPRGRRGCNSERRVADKTIGQCGERDCLRLFYGKRAIDVRRASPGCPAPSSNAFDQRQTSKGPPLEVCMGTIGFRRDRARLAWYRWD